MSTADDQGFWGQAGPPAIDDVPDAVWARALSVTFDPDTEVPDDLVPPAGTFDGVVPDGSEDGTDAVTDDVADDAPEADVVDADGSEDADDADDADDVELAADDLTDLGADPAPDAGHDPGHDTGHWDHPDGSDLF